MAQLAKISAAALMLPHLQRAYVFSYEPRKGETDPCASFESLFLSLIILDQAGCACLSGDSLQLGVL